MKKTIKKILRRENFGWLLYDRESLRIKAIDRKQFCNLQIKEVKEIIRKIDEFNTLSSPIKVFFEITKKCNIHCIHCSNNSGKYQDQKLHLDEIEKILLEMSDIGVFEVGINGGEPLCHPEFFDIINIIKSYGFPIYLNTNGVYNQLLLKRLAEATIEKIRISVDGVKDSHEYIRGKGTFDKTIYSIKYLKKMNNDVQINFTANKINKSNILTILKLANELDCSLKIAPMFTVGRAKTIIADRLSLIDCKEIKDQIDEFLIKNDIRVKIEVASDFITDKCESILNKYHYQFTKCGIRFAFLSIGSDGNVYNTGKQTDFCKENLLGNVRKKTISQLWELSKIKNEVIKNECGGCKNYNISSLLFESFNL